MNIDYLELNLLKLPLTTVRLCFSIHSSVVSLCGFLFHLWALFWGERLSKALRDFILPPPYVICFLFSIYILSFSQVQVNKQWSTYIIEMPYTHMTVNMWDCSVCLFVDGMLQHSAWKVFECNCVHLSVLLCWLLLHLNSWISIRINTFYLYLSK